MRLVLESAERELAEHDGEDVVDAEDRDVSGEEHEIDDGDGSVETDEECEADEEQRTKEESIGSEPQAGIRLDDGHLGILNRWLGRYKNVHSVQDMESVVEVTPQWDVIPKGEAFGEYDGARRIGRIRCIQGHMLKGSCLVHAPEMVDGRRQQCAISLEIDGRFRQTECAITKWLLAGANLATRSEHQALNAEALAQSRADASASGTA